MTSGVVLDADVPRRNGELVFAEPWQSRAFGMAVAMHQSGAYAWDDFRDRLKSEIAASEGPYYERWLAALERLVLEHGVLERGELDARAAEYRALQRDEVF
jgi:nitrile hydratase accessory protein